MTPFIEGLIAGYGIAIPVGAIAILIVEMGLRCGFKVGFMAGAGAATADLLYASLATLAGAVIIGWLEPGDHGPGDADTPGAGLVRPSVVSIIIPG